MSTKVSVSLGIEFPKPNPTIYLGTFGVNRQAISVAKSNPTVLGTLPKKEEGFIYTDLSKRIEADFMHCQDGQVPEKLKCCQSVLEEMFKSNNGLHYFELPKDYRGENSNAYAVEFLSADNITRSIAQYIGDFDEEHIGYYNTNLISQVLGISIEACNKIQEDSPSTLGALICGRKYGLEQLADAMLSQERYPIQQMVGEIYNWEDNVADVIVYGGKKYYYWFTY